MMVCHDKLPWCHECLFMSVLLLWCHVDLSCYHGTMVVSHDMAPWEYVMICCANNGHSVEMVCHGVMALVVCHDMLS